MNCSLLYWFACRGFMVTAMLLMGISNVQSADYLAPDPVKELFRVEEVKLSVYQLRDLSAYCVVLAQREQTSSAIDRRATAQFLALALRLDVGNQDARDLNQFFVKGGAPGVVSGDDVKHALNSMLKYQAWLGAQEAGAASNQLAHCISDVMNVFYQQAEPLEDLADWSGVVSPISAYGTVEAPISNKDQPLETFHLSKVSVKLLTPRDVAIQSINLTFNECDPHQLSLLQLGLDKERLVSASALQDKLNDYLFTRYEGLSAYDAFLTKAKPVDDHGVLATALSVMFTSSVESVPLRSDSYFCAGLRSDGSFQTPDQPWLLFRAMQRCAEAGPKNSGGLVIVPSTYEPLISEALVMGGAGFFLHWEIYSADSVDESIEVAAVKADDKVQKARELFQGIQDLRLKMEPAMIVKNQAVRARLLEIVTLCPNHYSAKMLLLCSSNNRPTKLSQRSMHLAAIDHMECLYEILQPYTDIQQVGTNNDKKYPLFDAIELEDAITIADKDLAVILKVMKPVHQSFYDSFKKQIRLYSVLANRTNKINKSLKLQRGRPNGGNNQLLMEKSNQRLVKLRADRNNRAKSFIENLRSKVKESP